MQAVAEKHAETSLINPAAEIARLHREILGAARTSLEKAIRIGELLTKQKQECGHGNWLPWLQANVVFHENTARNYMRVYAHRDELKSTTVVDLAEAYRLLAPPAEAALEVVATPAERSRFAPRSGSVIYGFGKGMGAHWDVTLVPYSRDDSFVHIAVLSGEGFEGPGTLEGTKKPIRHDHVERMLEKLLPYNWRNGFEWEDADGQPEPWNKAFYWSEAEYMEQVHGIRVKS